MSKQFSILLLLEGTYPWYRGGVSEWVHQYLSEFPDYDFRILQIATDEYLHRDLSISLYDVPENVHEFVRISPPDLSKEWMNESKRWFDANKDIILPLVEDIDIIHTTNTGFAGWLGVELSQKYDLPSVLTEHAIYWKEINMGAVALECGYKIPEQTSQKQRFVDMFKEMARTTYENSDVVVSVSECNMGEQEKLGVVDPVYIPNGVSKDFFYNNNRRFLREILTIGWIGRCANMKNPLRFFSLIDEFRKMPEFPVKFMMMLSDAGEKGLEQKIRSISNNYTELEIIWNQPAIKYIKKMDAVCITSYNESQPLVLFEAIANKALPVGWKAGDANGAYGLFVDQEAASSELSGKIIKLWKDQKSWAQKISDNFDFVNKNHTWETVFENYRKLFESLNQMHIS